MPRRAGVRFRVPRVVANSLEMEGQPRESFEYCGGPTSGAAAAAAAAAVGGGGEPGPMLFDDDDSGERSSGAVKWSIESSRDKAVCLRTHMVTIRCQHACTQRGGGGEIGCSVACLAADV